MRTEELKLTHESHDGAFREPERDTRETLSFYEDTSNNNAAKQTHFISL